MSDFMQIDCFLFSVGQAYANVGTASCLWHLKSCLTYLAALHWTDLSWETLESVNGH